MDISAQETTRINKLNILFIAVRLSEKRGVSLHRSNGREIVTNEENIKDMEVCATVSHLSVRNRQTYVNCQKRVVFLLK